MISTLGLPTTISPEEGVLPSSIVGIDPDFKMPQVWKTSLALDYQLPVSFPLTVTLEGMFSKDINAVRQYNYNVRLRIKTNGRVLTDRMIVTSILKTSCNTRILVARMY